MNVYWFSIDKSLFFTHFKPLSCTPKAGNPVQLSWPQCGKGSSGERLKDSSGEWGMCVKQILEELTIKGKVIKQGKFSLSYLAMLSPLKNRAISWSEDCHGKPLARITVSLSTVSDLLLHREKKKPK